MINYKTKCNKCGCDLEIKSVTCGDCNGTLPPNPVAGCEVTLIKHSKNGTTLKIGANDFVHIALFADHEWKADELAAYLKACLERGIRS